jgi:hypothetical protein
MALLIFKALDLKLKKRDKKGDCKERNETDTKRNKIKQKRNETRHSRNETKPKKSSINKKNETNINETIFFTRDKHFKELKKYRNTVIDTTLPKFINLFSSKANSLKQLNINTDVSLKIF